MTPPASGTIDPPDARSRQALGPGGPTGSAPVARQVELIIEKLDALPTLSPVAVRLLSVVSSADARIDEVVKLIESDPGLTTRILALVRRAASGLGDRVTTVRHATTMLGLEAVQSAVLGLAICELFEHAGHQQDKVLASGPALSSLAEVPMLDRVRLWTHLVGVACAAESIARHNPRSGVKPAEAFLCGLLHDTGKLALDLCLPASYARVLALAERRRCASADVERKVIGIDHHTVGKRLAERWGLPSMLRDTIWLHSRPLSSLPAEAPRATLGVVNAARALCREMHIGLSFDFARPTTALSACVEAGLDPGSLERVTPELHEAVAERCVALGLNVPTSHEAMLGSIAQANRKLASLNAALDERARQSESMRAALSAVGSFCQALRDPSRARSMDETLLLIASSLASIDPRTPVFVSFVLHRPDADHWEGWAFRPGGAPSRRGEIDAPREPDGSARRLADLLVAPGADARMLGLLPWLTDCMAGADNMLAVRAIPLCAGAGVGACASEPAAVLLTDFDPLRTGLSAGAFQTLVASWGAAIFATASIESATRLGERLAQSARELADAQHALADAQALSRLGEMAAGAAHEMNNPLTVIRARAQMLLRRMTSSQDRAAAEGITQAASQISDLITSMHLLASPPTPRIEPARPRELAEEAARKAQHRTGLDHEIRIDVPAYLPPMLADRDLFTLALSELIANALQSGPDPKVRVHAQIDPADDRLSLSVEDRGTGMSEHTLNHAFDPFFSDQPAGRRRGMGLARARSIVTAHKGKITLDSSNDGPSTGTRAVITLPEWRASPPMGLAA